MDFPAAAVQTGTRLAPPVPASQHPGVLPLNMSTTNVASVCFMTPTHVRDLRQFSVLRRSIEVFAPGIPHIAIVNTEDYAEFSDRFRRDRHLQIVKTADVLPGAIERRRRKSGPKWLTGKWLHKGLIRGWHAQQLAKLFALAECPYEAAAFIDSDVFVCRPLSPDYFHVNGRLKLFRRRAVNAECLDFDIATHDILGNPLHQVTDLFDYIFSPACFRKSTAIRLFAEFEARRLSSWVRRFLAQRRPSEYNLLGYSAMVLEQGAGYQLIECNPDDLHHSIRFPEDRARLDAEIERMREQPKDFALIQSTLGLNWEQIANAFARMEEAHRAASLTSEV
jgi:hypothetical protein